MNKKSKIKVRRLRCFSINNFQWIFAFLFFSSFAYGVCIDRAPDAPSGYSWNCCEKDGIDGKACFQPFPAISCQFNSSELGIFKFCSSDLSVGPQSPKDPGAPYPPSENSSLPSPLIETKTLLEVEEGQSALDLLSTPEFEGALLPSEEKQSLEKYPNYFKELIPPGTENTEAAEEFIEKALASILKRLQIPYVNQENQISTTGFFEKLNEIIQQEEKGCASVYVSGGVVRSLLGYIYEKVRLAKIENPTRSTQAILEEMETASAKIPTLEALGIGSDLDILVSLEEGTTSISTLEKGTRFINSAERKSGLKESAHKIKYSIVPMGDVNDYEKQMQRAMFENGGNTMDWLAFPILGGKIRPPSRAPLTFSKFVRGEFDYLPPPHKKSADTQPIRALRSQTEIPFLHLSREGEQNIADELSDLLKKVKAGEKLSTKAVEQFKKLVRNSRDPYHFWSSNHKKEGIEAMALELSKTANGNLIPEFVPNRDIKTRGNRDRCELNKYNLLTSKDSFLSENKNENALYHGTPEPDNILTIIRNGLILSRKGQGRADYGRGAYVTFKESVAKEYAGRAGVVLRFELKEDVAPRILNWPRVQNHVEIQKLIEKARQENVDLFEYLAEKCEVDIIVNKDILIQNTGVLSMPHDVSDLINTLFGEVDRMTNHFREQTEQNPGAVVSLIVTNSKYKALFELGRLLDGKNLKAPLDILAIILAGQTTPAVLKAAAKTFAALGDTGSLKRLLESNPGFGTSTQNDEPLLHSAAKSGNLSTFQLLLKKGARINEENKSKSTVLHIATSSGYSDLLKFALENKANPNSVNSDGETPLFMAACRGDFESVTLLLENKASVDYLNNENDPLLCAIKYQHKNIIEALASRGATVEKLIKESDSTHLERLAFAATEGGDIQTLETLSKENKLRIYQTGLLIKAASSGQTEVINFLVEKGSNIDEEKNGAYALFEAIFSRHAEVLKLLLAKKANTNIRWVTSQSPFKMMNDINHFFYFTPADQIEILSELAKTADKTELVHAIYFGIERGDRNDLVEGMLKGRPDLIELEQNGRRPLHLASEVNNMRIVHLLLNKGADPNAASKSDGSTPLHWAAKEGMIEPVKILIQAEAKLDLTTRSGETALYIAAKHGYKEIVELLLNHNANFSTFPENGLPLLEVAKDAATKKLIDDFIRKKDKTKK